MIRIDTHPSPKKLRQFGVTLLLLSVLALLRGQFAAGLFGLPHRASGFPMVPLAWFFLLLSAASLAVPRLVRWPFLGLSYLTYPLGLVGSQIILLVLYFGLIVPTGLCLRMLGRDRLGIRDWNSPGSRWKPRAKNSDRSYYLKQ